MLFRSLVAAYTLSHVPTSVTETLYVGDSGVDMQTAANAGVTSVGVTWGFRPLSELHACGARHVAHRVEEILQIIASV